MAINFPTGIQAAPFDANMGYDHGSTVSISNQNTWNNIGLETGDITIKDTNSFIFYWCELSTETDGVGTGHGVARIQYSTDSGSNWTTHYYYNITGSNENDIGNGLRGYHDHDLAAGTSYRLRCQYLKNGSQGNHTVADTGPGETPVTRLFFYEVNT